MKSSNKVLFVFALVVLVVMFITGMVLSMLLNLKQKEVYSYQKQLETAQRIADAKSSEDYQTAYEIQEEHSGEEGEIIYK